MQVKTGCSLLPVDPASGRILVSRRSMLKKSFPGLWETIGGALEAGETPEECVRREVQEEIGSGIDKLHELASWSVMVGQERHILIAWTGLLTKAATPNPLEIDELAWIDESGIYDREFCPSAQDMLTAGFAWLKKNPQSYT